jgi:hypothetical protein
MLSRDVHAGLKHRHREGYTWNPADEAYDGEEGEDDPCHPEMLVQVIDCSANGECDVQNTGYPDELLCEGSGHKEVCPGESKCDADDENEEDKGVGVEGEVIIAVIDASAIEAFIFGVGLD